MAGSMRGSSMRGGRMRRSMSEINVVPYIDVMLVLLVIFMVTAPMVTPGNIELPSVARSSLAPVAPIEIIIKADKSMTLRAPKSAGQRDVSIDQLVATVVAAQAANADQPIVISADKTVQYDAVLQVMSALQKQNIKHVGLAVKPAP